MTPNIRHNLRIIILALVCLTGSQTQAQTDQAEHKTGAYLGAIKTFHPDWFKRSFLDLDEDIAEAAEENKRLIVYFTQEGCPYCNRLVVDNFTQADIVQTTQDNFDLVMLNMWGDRDVIHVGGQTFTEKNLADALNVDFTPTLLFFDEKKNVVLRLNGYYPPEEFRQALEYVSSHLENQSSFSRFLAEHQPPASEGALHQEDWLLTPPYLLDKFNNKPLVVIFEQRGCEACDNFHLKTMAHDESIKLIEGFNAIQLDRFSDTEITTPEGEKTTARDWAESLGINYSPSLVFFDSEGKQVIKAEAFFKTFHLQGSMAYVLEKAYQTEPNFQRYLSARGDRIRETGVDTDIWAY